MNIRDALTQVLADTQHSQTWLAERMGYNNQSGIGNILWRGNIKLDTLCRICEVLDYEITMQPRRGAGRRPDGQVVLTWEEEK